MPLFTRPEDAPDELTRLILHAVPRDRHGWKTLQHFSTLMGVSKWGVRKWINAQRVPPERVMDIVRIGEGRVKVEDFHKFVFRSDDPLI